MAKRKLYSQKELAAPDMINALAVSERAKRLLNFAYRIGRLHCDNLKYEETRSNLQSCLGLGADELAAVLQELIEGRFIGYEALPDQPKDPFEDEDSEINSQFGFCTIQVDLDAIQTMYYSTKAQTDEESWQTGIVYLVKAGPFYKIGRASDFERRPGQIKLQLPYPVEVVHKIQAADAPQFECHWHERFAAQRQNGEWFILSEADVMEFMSYSKM